jgi:predicted nucleic acid-binding protein
VIFVDTGAWFAAFVSSDPDHAAAAAWLRNNTAPLVTTDYVLDELLTLLLVRREIAVAMKIGPLLLDQSLAVLEWVSPTDVRDAWVVFQNYRDKAWSFTDCVSRVVMERNGIVEAFAFDDHFRQFGTVTVSP